MKSVISTSSSALSLNDHSCFNPCVCVFRRAVDNLTPEERDARTVFCMQLAARIRPRDLEDFFSAVGKVPFIFFVALSVNQSFWNETTILSNRFNHVEM